MKYLLAFVMCTSISINLFAHNVVGGVYASGAEIEGEVGFSNGAMAKTGTLVKVFDQAGTPLGEVQTDDEGFFVFTATKRITHIFDINMGAGHAIKLELPGAELPDSLAGQAVSPSVKKSRLTVPATNVDGLSIERLETAIAKQIKPLRREISALKEKSGLRDIIGGIGYIFGLLGIVALLREHRLKGKK
jgi:hypothetical protein